MTCQAHDNDVRLLADPRWWDLDMLTEAQMKTRHPRRIEAFQRRSAPPKGVREFAREVDQLIGRRIKAARVWFGYRQIDLAHAIGVTQPCVSRIERGRRPASFSEIVRIAVQLKRPVDEFIAPPPTGTRTGWARRRVLPTFSRDLYEQHLRGELPLDDEFYD